jgi:hypothetical protein
MVLKAELEYRTKGGPFQGAVTIRIFFVKKLFFDYLVEQRAPLPPSGRSAGLTGKVRASPLQGEPRYQYGCGSQMAAQGSQPGRF